jgi:flagellar biosynthetic protein FlhB
MAEDLGEKTEEATPRKLSRAREEGQIPRSTDLASAILLTCGTLTLWLLAGPTLERLGSLVVFAMERSAEPATTEVTSGIRSAVSIGLTSMLPLLLAGWVAAYLGHLWQVGVIVTAKPLTPKLEKLHPIKGLKRLVGVQMLVKGGLDLGKTVVALGVAGLVSWRMHDVLVVLPEGSAAGGFAVVGRLMLELALVIAAALLVLAILDFMFQRWKHQKDNRMSKMEVREDHKESEGDPRVKQKRLQMARQMAMQRITKTVPTADVIVTNPEHISVAIKYDETRMHAPVVVAIGVDHLALRIRRIAAQHGIPIVERKPLARLLHRTVRTGEPIPPESYAAVAEVLAFVYRMNGQAA